MIWILKVESVGYIRGDELSVTTIMQSGGGSRIGLLGSNLKTGLFILACACFVAFWANQLTIVVDATRTGCYKI
jgi:hypothetical protein